MNVITAAPGTDAWVYVKLYLGRAMDRMDRLLIDLGQEAVLGERAQQWFFIRYVDEGGVHIRLRARGRDGDSGLLTAVIDACARRLGELPTHPPGDYRPMVTLPGFELTLDHLGNVHSDVKVVEDVYEPETDKYGARPAMDIAERLFDASSRLAVQVLADEERGRLSRKDIAPALMHEASAAFLPRAQHEVFWREYSYYWLNGRTPAAEDWRQKFADKGRELAQRGITLLADAGAQAGLAAVQDWSRAVRGAAAAYAQADAGTSAEVLAFNFVHLMNNRLGLAALEEAYMAALLERHAAAAQAEAA